MLAIGLDIGNATTEAVLAEVHSGQILVRAADRLPTRGAKGSPASLDQAARLVTRLSRAAGRPVEAIAVAPLRPVTTRTAVLPEPRPATGRLRLVAAGVGTTGGAGFGVGPPYRLGDPAPAGPVVAVVPAALGYRDALPALRELAGSGRLAAVVVERDEAVLLANRLGGRVPVVDEVSLAEVAGARLLAVEAGPSGSPVRVLSDPLRLTVEFGLSTVELADAARLAARLTDRSNAVVALDRSPRPVAEPPTAWVTRAGGDRQPLAAAHPWLRTAAPGLCRSYELPGQPVQPVDDLFTVDLAAVADATGTGLGPGSARTLVLAALHGDAPAADPSPALAARLDRPVHAAASEARAASLGAHSTPGAPAGALVIDLGGGTVDAVDGERAVLAAGAGDLLTAATAVLLGTSRTTAEYAKRGPAHRVESPQVRSGEDGHRRFTDRPLPPDTIGTLVVDGPAGPLTVHRGLSLGEWRAWRLRLKAEVLGVNVARALAALDVRPATVVVVGGPAGDDEVLGCLARVLPDGVAVGRGNAAGRLGHRYVVAYGLLLASFAEGRSPGASAP